MSEPTLRRLLERARAASERGEHYAEYRLWCLAADLEPGLPILWVCRSWAEISLRRLRAAGRSAIRALRLDPRSPNGWRVLGVALYEGRHHQWAARCQERSLKCREAVITWLLLGHCHERLGRPGRAVRALRGALRLAPDDSEAWANLVGVVRNRHPSWARALGQRVTALAEHDPWLQREIEAARTAANAAGQEADR